ncbi:MAG: hypothetical protein HKO62_00445, partial [Gammaproteobacteria bacterium]|nr:hypothetical protein [Gammaproteobacteria bacterium]
TDQETGLVKAPGWKQVKTHCTACHSARLIVQQRGDKDQWLKIIRWMQRTQNLWIIPPGDESAILAYLASSYPPGATFRRQGLATHLLPPAPRSE